MTAWPDLTGPVAVLTSIVKVVMPSVGFVDGQFTKNCEASEWTCSKSSGVFYELGKAGSLSWGLRYELCLASMVRTLPAAVK